MDADFRKRFLAGTDHTGRFTVTSQRTGRTYYVEAIGDPHVEWGSVNPGTKDLMVKKAWKKYRGSVDAEDSLITKENGFTKIHELEPGMSPHQYIDHLDLQYPDKVVA